MAAAVVGRWAWAAGWPVELENIVVRDRPSSSTRLLTCRPPALPRAAALLGRELILPLGGAGADGGRARMFFKYMSAMWR